MWNVAELDSVQALEDFLNALLVTDEIEDIIVQGGIFTVVYYDVA